MSVQQNAAQIAAIQTELAKTIKFSEMNNAQKRAILDQLLPDGYALWYTDPKGAIGDKVFGWGDPDINDGGVFFAEIAALPGTVEANLNFKLEF